MPSLASLARDAAIATTIVLSAANLSSANAQQMANAGAPAVSIETAGQVAADMCRRRGVDTMRMPDCIRDERNRMFQQIGQQASTESSCADQVRAGIESGRFRRESLATVLAGRPAREVGACNILQALSRG